MTSHFPLFDSTLNLTSKNVTELSHEEKSKLALDIKNFGKNAQELIYGLIKSYDINIGESSPIGLPFNGKKLKSGPKFNLVEMPLRLQHMLLQFVKMHKESEARKQKLKQTS